MKTWQAVTRTAHSPAQMFREFSVGNVATHEAEAHARQGPPFRIFLGELSRRAVAGWKWLERKRTQQLAARRIRVSETVSLGEKRFVSILQVDGTQFLIGGAAGSVSLLARLDKQEQQDAADWRNCSASTEKDR